MIKLCIFDLDGTLLDTLENITYYVNKTMEKFSLSLLSQEDVKEFVGNGAKLLIKRSVDKLKSDLPLDLVLTEYLNFYNSDPAYLIKPYDGILPMLDKLKKIGVKIAVLSNKPDSSTSAVVDEIFGENYFYMAYGQRDNVPQKPNPTAVFEIIRGFNKNECIFVGDTKVDIETGKSSGIKTIGVLWGFRDEMELRSAGADYIVSDADKVINIIKKL